VTDHDRTISYNGNNFVPSGGFSASARQHAANLKPNNLEIVGVLDSSAITEEDLRAGRYRNATITETLVDWMYPWLGAVRENVYSLSEVTFDGEMWEAQVESRFVRLRQARGDVWGRTCEYDLGDARCSVDLDALEVTGAAVTAVTTQRRVFDSDIVAGDCSLPGGATATPGADGHFDFGELTWTSGNNNGITAEVKLYTAETGGPTDSIIELQVNLPFDIEVGDTFDIKPGCSKLKVAACKEKYDNLANYGGNEFIPGNDAMLETP
tara:strand:- start:2765 stop:3565 length:801 start_codon:yes stop_codon:yes gene_type:complete